MPIEGSFTYEKMLEKVFSADLEKENLSWAALEVMKLLFSDDEI